MSRWLFKPALLRTAQEWRLDGAELVGPEGHLDLRDLERAAFVDQKVRGYRFTRLDLITDAQTFSVPITSPPTDEGGIDPDRAQFLSLTRALAARLAEISPELPVAIGDYGRSALIMFLLGVLSMLVGIGIGGAALISGVSGDRLGGVAVPVLILIAFGGAIAWSRRPWKPQTVLPAGKLPVFLSAYSGATQPSASASADAE